MDIVGSGTQDSTQIQITHSYLIKRQGIASGNLSLVGFFLLPESYSPCVLQRKLKVARKSQSNDQLYSVLDFDEHPTGVGAFLSKSLRPGAPH